MSLQVSSIPSQISSDILSLYLLMTTAITCCNFLFFLCLAAQEPAPQENGDADLIPRKCDIIAVTGRAEKCELARAALLVRNFSFALFSLNLCPQRAIGFATGPAYKKQFTTE